MTPASPFLKSDRLFGICWLLLSVAMGVLAWQFEAPIAYEPIGPRSYPLLVAGLMAACGAWFVARPGPESRWPDAALWRKIVAMGGVLLAYAFLFQPFGFPLATALLTVGLGRLYGGGWKQCVIGGALMGVGLYFFFDTLLDVTVPAGNIWKVF